MDKPRYRLTTIGECKAGDRVFMPIMGGKLKPMTIHIAGRKSALYYWGFTAPERFSIFATVFPVPGHREVWRKVS